MSVPIVHMNIPLDGENYPLSYIFAWESSGPTVDYPIGYGTLLATSCWDSDNSGAFWGPEIW